MPVGAIMGAASIGGAALSSNAAKKAANAQASAAQGATSAQLRMFNKTQENLKPFIDTGKGAMFSLANLYGIATPGNPNPTPFNADAIKAFEASPDYGFALDQGQKAMQYSLGAKGMLRSGAALQELQKLGQGLATQNFGNYAGRLFQLASLGNAAAGTSASAGTATGTGMAATMMAGGNAQAAGYIGQANAINSGIGSSVNNLMLWNQMQKNNSAYQPTMLQQYGPSAFNNPSAGYQPAPFYGVGTLPY